MMITRIRLARFLALSAVCLAASACCDLAITTAELPDGKVGEAYSVEFGADCDNDQWELISGDLPPGLTLNEGGELTGVPTLAGLYTMTVGVSGQGDTDSFVSKGFSIAIIQPVGTLQVTTATSGSGTDPNGYTVTVNASQYLIGTDDTLTLFELPVGDVTVALGGLDVACAISGLSPIVVTIVEGAVATARFDVVCGP